MTTPARTHEIHPALDTPLLHDLISDRSPLWTPADLRTLTSTVAARLRAPLTEAAEFTEPKRWWARLALTDEVELWLLTWLPGQRTRPHDHGGASGSFTVLLGELAETYRYPQGPIRHRLHKTGAALGFGQGRAHQVQNLGTTPAASVHAYSPPLVETRQYTSLRDVPHEIPALPHPRGPHQ
ncbi:cysteine dioxygenase [Actinokineospora pegani]|uniref:cysteine dioxygenase n=1 Tax=Actinokineospora pegani TaxID=2654637 RepID=UPI0012E9B2CC|nr:cysteine dioxygenase family protein [Actinokineospora pegani]